MIENHIDKLLDNQNNPKVNGEQQDIIKAPRLSKDEQKVLDHLSKGLDLSSSPGSGRLIKCLLENLNLISCFKISYQLIQIIIFSYFVK